MNDHDDRKAAAFWGIALFRFIIGGGMIFIVLTITLYSDRHNDERYVNETDLAGDVVAVGDGRWVMAGTYVTDQENTKAKLAAIEKAQETNASQFDRKLDGIQQDLREVRNLLWTLNKRASDEK